MSNSDRNTATWLTEGHHVCPAWCDGFHSTGDAYDDRVHVGLTIAIALTADEPDPDEEEGTVQPGVEGLPHINMNLTQHYREEWPRIWVGRGGSRNGFHLTLAEAEALATRLRDLVDDDGRSRRETVEREERAERESDAARAE